MADYDGNHSLLDGKLSCVPDDCYQLGYTNKDGSIHIGAYYPLNETLNTEASIRTTILHELRHVWQKKYEANTYYKKNAVGAIEAINDIAEIDADAFALAYMKNRTSYPESEYMEQLDLYMHYDRGARKNRTRMIKNKYFS